MDRPSAVGTLPDDAKAALAYDGRLSELFAIFLADLVLTIITFGIYHFWAVTRMRHYLWSHMRFEDTRFSYTGKGKELLVGCLQGLLILALLFAAAAAAEHALREAHPAHAPLPYVTGAVGMFVLFGAARFAALRYRISHTEWRGICGGMEGSALRYGANRMVYLLACVLTLAQAVPWMQSGLVRWRIEASHFGSAVFRCDVRGRHLLLPWLAMIFSHVVLVGVVVAIVAGFEGPWLAHVLFGRSKAPIAHVTEFKVVPALVGAVVIVIGSRMLATSYQAKRVHLVLNRTSVLIRGRFRNETLTTLQFGTTVETDSLAWLVFTNQVILVLTLGLGMPVVLHRNARFIARTTCLMGTFDANTLARETLAPSSIGNGYLQTLDPESFGGLIDLTMVNSAGLNSAVERRTPLRMDTEDRRRPGKLTALLRHSMGYHRRMRFTSAILLALGLTTPLAAQPLPNPLSYIPTGQWTEAWAAAGKTGDPVAEKLIDYLRMLTPNAARAAEIDVFMRQNPDWPLPTIMARRRLEAMAVETDNAALAALCTQPDPVPTPPVTHGYSPPPSMPARGAALLRCAGALADLGRGKEAEAIAREAWVSAISDPATEAVFLSRFPTLLSEADQWARFQRLAWDDTVAAHRQIARLNPAHAALAEARVGLKSNVPGATARADEDPGAMLDLARAYRKLNQDQAALALWRSSGAAAQKAAPDHLPAFWTERQYLAHQLLRDGDAQGAYDVVIAHGQSEPEFVAEAEFLGGFIALRRLNNPTDAVRHFNALAATSHAVITQSRASYWLGRSQAAMGRNPIEDYLAAATWPTTFYGQIAARAAGQTDAVLVGKLRVAPTPTPGLENTPSTMELARAAVQLISWGDTRHARPFLLRMDELAHTPAARVAVGNYAAALALPDVTVIVVRRLGRDGVMPPLQGWPVAVDPPATAEPAVSLAITRQESNFDIGAISPSGARGLMQLMPATARQVAHRLGEATSNELLTSDPGHNMRMGTAYLQEMLNQFGGSVPLAAAAYNAGPHRVNQWLVENGDPRVGNQSMIDWIEMIPFNETRNYVQRVLENVVVYQARLYGTVPPAMAQWTR